MLSTLNTHWEDWCWSWSLNTLATWCQEPDAGKDWRPEEEGTTEDEMVGWHCQHNGHEFEQAPGDGEGQGSLECYSPWGCREPNMTEQLNNNKKCCEFPYRCGLGILQELNKCSTDLKQKSPEISGVHSCIKNPVAPQVLLLRFYLDHFFISSGPSISLPTLCFIK